MSNSLPLSYIFRRYGHLAANLDPLDRFEPISHPQIDKASGPEAQRLEIYCSKIGAEFMHFDLHRQADWVAERMENFTPEINPRFLLERLTSAEIFESFIHTKYVGSKWFSLQGLVALVPLVDTILERACDSGFETAIIAMSHRGRLNLLYHICGAPLENIYAFFEDVDARSVLGSGDTKYHKGATGIYKARSGKEITVRFASNPSHLEAVNPVVMGRVRAKQDRLGNDPSKQVLLITIHGDAAFSGQGISAETLNLADIPGYSIGGTIDIVANNLIGFTATPKDLQSGRYCTDVAKRLPIPIFHVNGESPEDVAKVGQLALDYRVNFSSGVVIDLIGYRRFGHNEVDDPTTSAPVLYEKIKAFPLLYRSYAKKIGVSDEEVNALVTKYTDIFRAGYESGQQVTKQPKLYTLPAYWASFSGGPYDKALEVDTGVDNKTLMQIAAKLTAVPDGFNVHPKIKKLLEQRLEMVKGGRPVDWGMAEALSFGSLLWNGTRVRLSGQDCRRGTFSHRQSVLYDIKTGNEFIPLSNLHAKQGVFQVWDSCLSEAAVLGYEYGYSRDYPDALVCWEAQFGDFVNGAQTIIDQFICAGEDKWQLLSGIVMLLPHGYEGQGPEHSSARLERFLQLAGEDNIQVCVPSTSGQYFHLLRRQYLRKWRKPLIVLTPKSLLRAAPACSAIDALSAPRFANVLSDNDKFIGAKRILICSGKIVHELRAEREKRGIADVAIITLEQLYPFPEEELIQVLQRFENADQIVWVQEEPANMGALFYVRPHLKRLNDGKTVTTVKRSASGSPATGSAKAHAMEQQALVHLAFADFS